MTDHPVITAKTPVAMFTPDNVKAPEVMSPEFQAMSPDQRYALAEQELARAGYRYEKVDGKYGTRERSLVVHNMPLQHAMDMGRRYGQESVVHGENGKHKMVYTNGPNAGAYNPSLPKVDISATEPPDNYTLIPGIGYVTLYFDWNKFHPVGHSEQSNGGDMGNDGKIDGAEIRKSLIETLNGVLPATPEDVRKGLLRTLKSALKKHEDELVAMRKSEEGHLQREQQRAKMQQAGLRLAFEDFEDPTTIYEAPHGQYTVDSDYGSVTYNPKGGAAPEFLADYTNSLKGDNAHEIILRHHATKTGGGMRKSEEGHLQREQQRAKMQQAGLRLAFEDFEDPTTIYEAPHGQYTVDSDYGSVTYNPKGGAAPEFLADYTNSLKGDNAHEIILRHHATKTGGGMRKSEESSPGYSHSPKEESSPAEEASDKKKMKAQGLCKGCGKAGHSLEKCMSKKEVSSGKVETKGAKLPGQKTKDLSTKKGGNGELHKGEVLEFPTDRARAVPPRQGQASVHALQSDTHREYLRSQQLQAKWPGLHSPADFKAAFLKDPDFMRAVARSYWDSVNSGAYDLEPDLTKAGPPMAKPPGAAPTPAAPPQSKPNAGVMKAEEVQKSVHNVKTEGDLGTKPKNDSKSLEKAALPGTIRGDAQQASFNAEKAATPAIPGGRPPPSGAKDIRLPPPAGGDLELDTSKKVFKPGVNSGPPTSSVKGGFAAQPQKVIAPLGNVVGAPSAKPATARPGIFGLLAAKDIKKSEAK